MKKMWVIDLTELKNRMSLICIERLFKHIYYIFINNWGSWNFSYEIRRGFKLYAPTDHFIGGTDKITIFVHTLKKSEIQDSLYGVLFTWGATEKSLDLHEYQPKIFVP